MNQKVLLVLGAKSDIGIAVAHRFAKEGFDVQLVGRNSQTLEDDCTDITIRYNVKSSFHEFDALDINAHEKFISSLPQLPNVVISAVGSLGSQKEDELDTKKMINTLRANFEGVAVIFSLFANIFKKRGYGTLIGISSVAGDRGRGSNYIYGSSKAGLTSFLSGLRNRLYPFGVEVITIKPGFVLTKMTSHLKLNKSLTTHPHIVADYIYSAFKRKKNIIYIVPIWKYIMLIIKCIPENFFKRMKL
tara:strand:+ start:941 stop:1678 length:738 start_codon:yes stop_codon:yes gene_type:complete